MCHGDSGTYVARCAKQSGREKREEGKGRAARKHASDVVVEADKVGGRKDREGCVVR